MADKKLQELVDRAAAADTDIIYVVADPAGSPVDHKLTLADLRTYALDGVSINRLADVDTVTVPPTNGQVLVWNETSGQFEPGTINGTDFAITDTGLAGEVLVHQGEWYRFAEMSRDVGSHNLESTSNLTYTEHGNGVRVRAGSVGAGMPLRVYGVYSYLSVAAAGMTAVMRLWDSEAKNTLLAESVTMATTTGWTYYGFPDPVDLDEAHGYYFLERTTSIAIKKTRNDEAFNGTYFDASWSFGDPPMVFDLMVAPALELRDEVVWQPLSVGDLSDVNVVDVLPEDGSYLRWSEDRSEWVAAPDEGGSGDATSLQAVPLGVPSADQQYPVYRTSGWADTYEGTLNVLNGLHLSSDVGASAYPSGDRFHRIYAHVPLRITQLRIPTRDDGSTDWYIELQNPTSGEVLGTSNVMAAPGATVTTFTFSPPVEIPARTAVRVQPQYTGTAKSPYSYENDPAAPLVASDGNVSIVPDYENGVVSGGLPAVYFASEVTYQLREHAAAIEWSGPGARYISGAAISGTPGADKYLLHRGSGYETDGVSITTDATPFYGSTASGKTAAETVLSIQPQADLLVDSATFWHPGTVDASFYIAEQVSGVVLAQTEKVTVASAQWVTLPLDQPIMLSAFAPYRAGLDYVGTAPGANYTRDARYYTPYLRITTMSTYLFTVFSLHCEQVIGVSESIQWVAKPPSSLEELDDVDVTTSPPSSGQALVWNGTEWAPATVSGGSEVAVVEDLIKQANYVPKSAKVENYTIPASSAVDLCNLTDQSGTMVYLWFTANSAQDANLCKGLYLNMYVDGEVTPSVSLEVGTLGTHWAQEGTDYHTEHITAEIDLPVAAYGWRFPVPFGTSLRVELSNPSASASIVVYSTLIYTNDVTDNRRLKSAGTGYLNVATANAAADYTLLDYSGGPGTVVWHSLAANSPTNLTFLERNVKLTLDGTHVVESSGTEDWFNGAFYYVTGEKSTPWSFVARINSTARETMQALDLKAMMGGITFNQSVLMEWKTEAAVTANNDFAYTVLYYTGTPTASGVVAADVEQTVLDYISDPANYSADGLDTVLTVGEYRALVYYTTHNSTTRKTQTASYAVPVGKKALPIKAAASLGVMEDSANRRIYLRNTTLGADVMAYTAFSLGMRAGHWMGDAGATHELKGLAAGETAQLEVWSGNTDERSMGGYVILREVDA